MNTIIIQPIEAPPPIKNREGFTAVRKLSFSPALHLLSLDSHININSRHQSLFIDLRTLNEPMASLMEQMDEMPAPRAAVVDATTMGLPYSLQVIAQLKTAFPDLTIGVCGQHAADFPAESIAIEGVSFVLSGDPEPILKQYLDYIDLPQRMGKTPGLQLPDLPVKAAAYLPEIAKVIPPPAWPANFWAQYRIEGPPARCEADLQLTRGNSGLPPDRAHPNREEPLRIMDLRMMSNVMERCSAVSVNHVNISDPPGVWSQEFLLDWCNTLADFHVRQSWGFKTLPISFSRKEHSAMYESWCKRVDFIFPSCDPEILKRYGITLDLDALKETIATLKRHHIAPTIRYWTGGPEAPPDEVNQIVATIRETGFCDFILQPFPLHHSSQVYQEYADHLPSPTPQDFMRWADDPEKVPEPVALWGGEAQIKTIEKTASQILRTINRSPGRMLKRLREQLTNTPWIEKLETKSASIDVIGPPTRDL